MDKIKRHNFDIAKGNIEKFSRNLPSDPSFDRVETDGGLFGWGDHNVTGEEMNNFIGKVQDKFISVNHVLNKIVGEFREVYRAFDFLDREYISGIIGAVESAEEASQQALKAQKDINDTVENLKKTVIGLVNLKSTVEIHQAKLSELHDQIDKLAEETNKKGSAKLYVIIEELAKSQENKNKLIVKKLKIAYGIGGGAVAFSIVQLILQLMGIL